jgi:predicted transcriptional regulator
VKRVFNGSAKPLLVHLVENMDVDGAQIEEISRLLKEKKLLKEKRRKK